MNKEIFIYGIRTIFLQILLWAGLDVAWRAVGLPYQIPIKAGFIFVFLYVILWIFLELLYGSKQK